MIIVKVWGGIGNQLFQYVFGQYLKHKYNQEVRYDDNSFVATDKLRKRELDAIDEIIEYDNRCSFSKYRGIENRLYLSLYLLNPKHHFISEQTEMPQTFIDGHIYFFQGYWQDIKYYQWLLDNTSFKLAFKKTPTKLDDYVNKISKEENSVSIHIRRGDYFAPQNVGIYGVCDTTYFNQAIERIKLSIESPHLFIFSDDIEWVKNNIPLDNQCTIIENYDIPQLSYIVLMSLCKHHIISNSSFSWWGAVLNRTKEAIVVSPSKWTLTSDRTIALNEWLKI